MTALIVLSAAIFALLPGLVVLLASLTASQSIAFPPQGFSLRWYQMLFTTPEFIGALTTSVTLAGVTAVLAVALSVPAALAIVRHRLPGTAAIEAFLLSPLAVPHVVIGIGILQLYSYWGIWTDIVALSAAHLLITVPFVIRMLIAALSGLQVDAEKAAASLGATPLVVLLTVTLPQIKTGIAGALIAAFVLSFDDLALTVFLATPGYNTIPTLLFNQAENALLPVIHAASVILLVASWGGVFLIDRLIGFERLIFPPRSSSA